MYTARDGTLALRLSRSQSVCGWGLSGSGRAWAASQPASQPHACTPTDR